MKKKYIISGAVILAILAIVVWKLPKNGTPTTRLTNVSTTTPTAPLKDGSYTGKVADAYFGNVQVQAMISGGKLTDVQFLQYPQDRPASARISNNAMPILKSEAITAQNSQVDIVSGATQTSQAFSESLADALSQAHG